MIRILKANEVEKDWFSGRVFGETNQTVQAVIGDVVQNGDAALKKYGQKFDVSAPESLLIPESELKAAAEKLHKEHPETYDAICYSHDLAMKFALCQKNSFDDFEVELVNCDDALIKAINNPNVDGVIRGSLSASNLIKSLKKANPN